jgi:sialate O-acetylesterase
VAGLVTALIAPGMARAQQGGAKPSADAIRLKEPSPHRVYQRDRNGLADIAVVADDEGQGAEVVGASVFTREVGPAPGVRFEGGKLLGVPEGGPYDINVTVKRGDVTRNVHVEGVFVGDLWVLAGQSNMEGYADLIDVTPPHPQVMVLGMNGEWSQAEEPLHWLVDSPDPVHSGDPATRSSRSAEQHRRRVKGAGLGLPFAVAMVEATGVPVGLVACAHGGTSMAQWDPARKDQGGKSLYGSMLRQLKLAGGKVKGVLWYQGESDANPKAAEVYPKAFADLIAAVRSDLEQPELPFYYVQIGRVVRAGEPKAWNAVQDAQRRLAERVPNTAVVAVIDLELDDGIHVGTRGLKRAGRRLARVALRELFGQAGATTPTFDRVTKGAGNALVVKFKGVNITPEVPAGPGALPGFGAGGLGGMRGPGGQGMMSLPAENAGGGFRQVPVRAPSPYTISPGAAAVVGLNPPRHIAGFSIRREDGTEVPLIFDAAVGKAHDTVTLRLNGPLPRDGKAFLWYGYGFDPYCDLTDALDMAVPVFGPVPLDDLD